MKEYTKEYLDNVCERIKSMGFRVFVKKDSTYGYFSDGKGVGYFQLEWGGFAGVSVSTVNAKGSGCTGYGVEAEIGFSDLTEELLREAFQKYPNWVRSSDMKVCNKYKGLDDFLQNYWDKDNLIEYESTN